jgi:hypothetical protein
MPIMRIFTYSLLVTVTLAIGCGGGAPMTETADQTSTSSETTAEDISGFVAQRPQKKYANPSESVSDFLIAVKSGDDVTATALLTTNAQKEAWTNGLAISGDGFPDAQFNVSEVEYLNQNSEAHVMSTWSDKTPYDEEKTFQCVWLLRRESHGWCIYGMATKFLEHLQPIVLNFENQADMQKRQQWAEQQIVKHRELELHQEQALTAGPKRQAVTGQQPAQQQQQQQQIRHLPQTRQATQPNRREVQR